MNGIRTWIVIGVGLLILASSGCAKRNPTRTEGGGNADLQRTASERVSDTQRNIRALNETVAKMPGSNETEDRKLTAQALGQTAAAISAIEGERPSGAFRQQLRIIENARGQLTRMSESVPSEPVTDSALRAAYNALVSMRDGRFAGSAPVAKAVSDVGQQIQQLDSVRGPLHSLVVSQSFQSIASALDTMSGVLEGRLPTASTGAGATTRPAVSRL